MSALKKFWGEQDNKFLMQVLSFSLVVASLFLTIDKPEGELTTSFLMRVEFFWMSVIWLSLLLISIRFWSFFRKHLTRVVERGFWSHARSNIVFEIITFSLSGAFVSFTGFLFLYYQGEIAFFFKWFLFFALFSFFNTFLIWVHSKFLSVLYTTDRFIYFLLFVVHCMSLTWLFYLLFSWLEHFGVFFAPVSHVWIYTSFVFMFTVTAIVFDRVFIPLQRDILRCRSLKRETKTIESRLRKIEAANTELSKLIDQRKAKIKEVKKQNLSDKERKEIADVENEVAFYEKQAEECGVEISKTRKHLEEHKEKTRELEDELGNTLPW
jgi:sensor histidine kinase YesM